jgi:hypothetical protein
VVACGSNGRARRVPAQIVEHDNGTLCRVLHLLDIGAEHLAVDGSIDHQGDQCDRDGGRYGRSWSSNGLCETSGFRALLRGPGRARAAYSSSPRFRR